MSEHTTTTTSTAVTTGPKRHKTKQQQPPLTIPTGYTCFRLLCHSSRIGGVIGKSGVIIKQLQQQTQAKIRVEDPVPGCEDRVITVIGISLVDRTLSFNDSEEYSENVSVAQMALVRVFERVLVVAAEGEVGSVVVGSVSARLLVDKSIIGSVIGKGGKVIEKIRRDFGCKIRVLVQDKMSSCALPTDEMIEMEGDMLTIKKALITVSRCLQDCPHAHKAKMVVGRPHPAVSRETIANGHTDLPSVSSNGDTYPSMDSGASQQEVVFRILCSNDKVGCVIGKSGTIVQALKNESGASINIGAPVSDCNERLITISAMETPELLNSPAQIAVMLVFNRLVEAGFPTSTGTPVTARLLISPNQVGCLLGKRGSIITDTRKVTGAFIKIVGDHQVPKCALATDQVVLMTGEFINVQDALYSVTGRLRNNIFSSITSNGSGTRNIYARGNGYHSNEDTNLTQSMDSLKLSSDVDRPSAPTKWQSPMGHDIGTESTSLNGGIELGSAGRSARVTNMSVEIVVPENVIGSVYGENGSNLTRLREISGAKVVVQEPHSGTTDHIVVISGTPDETNSAQSLLQAFILADQS